MSSESHQVTLLDMRETASVGLDAVASRLDASGLRADLLSPVVTLSPRQPWVDGRGYLNFMSTVDSRCFFYGETDAVEIIAWADPHAAVEIWLTNLAPGLYVVVVEAWGFGAIGPGPAQFRIGSSAGAPQLVDATGSRQYLAVLIAQGEPPAALSLVGVTPHNLRAMQFYRSTVINLFG
jgi:hypothetical protein